VPSGSEPDPLSVTAVPGRPLLSGPAFAVGGRLATFTTAVSVSERPPLSRTVSVTV
jgi:hypothetical protein